MEFSQSAGGSSWEIRNNLVLSPSLVFGVQQFQQKILVKAEISSIIAVTSMHEIEEEEKYVSNCDKKFIAMKVRHLTEFVFF